MTEYKEEKGGPTFIHETARAIEEAEDRKQARVEEEEKRKAEDIKSSKLQPKREDDTSGEPKYAGWRNAWEDKYDK